jgi:hypothetical protein
VGRPYDRNSGHGLQLPRDTAVLQSYPGAYRAAAMDCFAFRPLPGKPSYNGANFAEERYAQAIILGCV